MDNNKKKTLTISTNLKKKIDTSSISSGNKKSFSVEKRKPYKSGKPFNRPAGQPNFNHNIEGKKKNFVRKWKRIKNKNSTRNNVEENKQSETTYIFKPYNTSRKDMF